MKSILDFFNQLKYRRGSVWLNNDNVKLFVPNEFQNQETKDFISANKSRIISVLKENQIDTRERFYRTVIFKDSSTSRYPLSPAQERLWFIEQFEGGSNAYHVPGVYELEPSTEIEGVKHALQEIVSRHEVLRSTIEWDDDRKSGIQVVHKAPLRIDEMSLKDTDDYESVIRLDINRPFDLNTEYPIRVKFFFVTVPGTSIPRILLLINMHHIASDGWSMGIFRNEFQHYYESYIREDKNPVFAPLPIQYKEYALWQRNYLTGDILNEQLKYWKLQLMDCQPLELPTDYERVKFRNYKGSRKRLVLNKDITEKLRNLAKKLGVSMHTVLLSGFGILLGKYSGQEDILIGSPIANRQFRQTEELIGFFVNTLVNRIRLNTSQSYIGLIQQVHQNQIEAQQNQDLPFERLVDELGLERNESKHPVFQVMFSVDNYESRNKTNKKVQTEYLKPYKIEDAYEVEKFDLSVFIDDTGDEITGIMSYTLALFKSESIERLMDHYVCLLQELTASPDKSYDQISILGKEEYNKIINEWNATDKSYPNDKTLHGLYNEQAKKTPNNIALVYEGTELSYKELNEKSNQLARYIRSEYKKRTNRRLVADTLIALYMEKSLEMIIGILGTLKAGAAYVPIDPSYPRERVDHILSDTATELVLTHQRVEIPETTGGLKEKVIYIDDSKKYEGYVNTNLSVCSSSNDLAYVIYTSGTTGKSKGVMIEHKAVLNTVNALNSVYDKRLIKKVTGYTSYVFDVFVSELFNSILQGLEFHILSGAIRTDMSALSDYVIGKKINLVYLPPVLLSQFPKKRYADLNTIIYAGEACNRQTVSEWSGRVKLFNFYGPTEASIYASGKQIFTNEAEQIGKPIQNIRVYVLDRNRNPVPIGITGELYISGAGLARGYLNHDKLTGERFIPNPFVLESEKSSDYNRLYKTGDLVKWLADGNIEFIGRNDDQVKIRGYRIELKEIENAIMQVQGVRQSCVLVKEKTTVKDCVEKYLIGYYVPEKEIKHEIQELLQEKLIQILPEYMIPSALVSMDSLPMTINGKLDKHALPDPDFRFAEIYVAPGSDQEKQCCDIWKEILGCENVGIKDNFFKIGGNSILAIQASHRMSKLLKFDVKVADIFSYKTISELLIHKAGKEQIQVPKTNLNPAILSFAQERLWFIEQYEAGTNAYHIPMLYELDERVDIQGVKYALQQIVSRHEVLRSTINQEENLKIGMQWVHDDPLYIEEVKLHSKDDYIEIIKSDINRPFELSQKYPLRIKLYYLQSPPAKKCTVLLLINMHHIASDGWSIGILEKEFLAYYEAYSKKDIGFRLPPLELQYKDYATWQRNYLREEILEKQLNYWTEKLSGYQTLKLPEDYPRPNVRNYQGEHQRFILNKELSRKIRDLAQSAGVTVHSVLLSGLGILLAKYSGQQDILIGSPTANRHLHQTEGMIGFFVNTQVNRIQPDRFQDYLSLIQKVHQDQIDAQLYQDLPFEMLVNKLVIDRDESRHPIFQVSFSVHSFVNHSLSEEYSETYFRPYRLENIYQVEKFDLSLIINDNGEALNGYVSYASSLFKKQTIEQFIAHYVRLMDELIKFPYNSYNHISLLGLKEYEMQVYTWNATDKMYPDKSIHELFEEKADNIPHHIALVCDEQELTYHELNLKSNQLARHIRSYYDQKTDVTLTADTRIAICTERSLEMIVGVLGILKAGGAYVPIDPKYPKERIDYILTDAKVELILTHRNLKTDCQLPDSKILYIDLSEMLYVDEAGTNLFNQSQSKDLAYVIYTSGTTGRPKGVMVEHGSVVNYSSNVNEVFLDSVENIDFSTNLVFDLSVTTTLCALLSGKKIIIYSGDITDLDHYCQHLVTNRIDFIKGTPSLLSILPIQYFTEYIIKQAFIGGEKLEKAQLNHIAKYIENPFDEYGPTEATVGTLIVNKKENNVFQGIGKPYFNYKIYVLDSEQIPVPIGVVGELYIGGAGLSRGYLNRPDLTLEQFIVNPFATESDRALGYTRLYRTGDLVKWLPDGNIEFIGRNDDQVKIRGYRVELAEIENTLLLINGIKQASVVINETKTEIDTNRYLVGYYVSDKSVELSSEFILSKLIQLLPEYMIPVALIEMESFPLTINGKLDKKSLPHLDFSSPDEYVAPSNETEIELSKIYAEVLGLSEDQISTHKNFFKMGGNSILSIQLKQKLNQLDKFRNISIAELFKYNSINKLIKYTSKNDIQEYRIQPKNFNSNNHEIAIIAYSGAFSGAQNVEEYWKLISQQQEGIRFYSREECENLGIYPEVIMHPDYIPVTGIVEGIELFDPLFWDISPNEAKQLNPQIRKFIEHCWIALESSGYSNRRKQNNIGVFAGSGNSDYFHDHILYNEKRHEINIWEASASNSKDALTTKTAFLLGLTGPANSINTACSTGLVTVVEACKNLQLGVCDMALAGGVSLPAPDQIGYIFKEGMILSNDGHCKTFDCEASGTTVGAGVGVVLLKRLDDAIKDVDSILGIIKGYSTNNDGDRKAGFTAPSIIGQSECIINAQKMAGIKSGQVDYVECHGTATSLGDPIEIQALKESFEYNGSGSVNPKTILGSVKANIGHADSAAGIAGLIKVCEMLKNNVMPGQVNFNRPNGELHLEQTNFEIIKKNRDWLPGNNKQRIAGVSSFGIGGTNAHLIIGDYIPSDGNLPEIENNDLSNDEELNHKSVYIIPLSAKSRKSLEQYKKKLLDYLTDSYKDNRSLDIQNLAYTLQERREHFDHRSAYVVRNIFDLIRNLEAETSYAKTTSVASNRIVFMFPGHGGQYPHMARDLYESEPSFKATVDQCISIANKYLKADLYDVMYPFNDLPAYNINEIEWSPISLFIIEYSLAKYLKYLGVEADAQIGHSLGEFAAAVLAGVFSLEDAIKVVIARGKLMQSMQPGRMLAINAGEEAMNEIVNNHNCEIAAINTSEDIVATGMAEDIAKLSVSLEKKGIPFTEINGSVAGHSRLMDEAENEFEKVFHAIRLNKPISNFFSSLTGEIAGKDVMLPKYWAKQLRNTVQFAKGISNVMKLFNYQVTFIEVGTGKGLGYFINKIKQKDNHQSIQVTQLLPSAKDFKLYGDCKVTSTENCGQDIKAKLWMAGVILRPNEIHQFRAAKLLYGLPTYQFENQKCWLEKSNSFKENKYNSLQEVFYERSWERMSQNPLPIGDKEENFKNVVVLINDSEWQNEYHQLLNVLNNWYDSVNCVIHGAKSDISNNAACDFKDEASVGAFFDKATLCHQIDLILYVSSTTSPVDPCVDIFAIRNIFNWSKQTGKRIPKFISVSYDNYDVTGNGCILKRRPSIIYGVTKSIPFEYYTSTTQTIHVDLSSNDSNYQEQLRQALQQTHQYDLIVIRNQYKWIPIFKQLTLSDDLNETDHEQEPIDPVIFISGGLGAIGYAYANYFARKNHKCIIILVGRSKEQELKNDYRNRLDSLRMIHQHIIYASIDIAQEDAFSKIRKVLADNHINRIDLLLHTAVVVAKNAMYEKTHTDIEQVVNPKIIGVENLIRIGQFAAIENFVCCSSLSSIYASLGQMEYTAANIYLDELSFRSHSNIKNFITINLNQVSDAGAAVEFIKNSSSQQGRSSNSIKSTEFPPMLEKILRLRIVNMLGISRYDINKEWFERRKTIFKRDGDEGNDKTRSIVIVEKNYSETEYKIANIFSGALGMDQISVYDDFFKIGGNSISAIKVSHRISESLGVEVSLADLFKYKTANALKNVLSVNKNSEKITIEKWII